MRFLRHFLLGSFIVLALAVGALVFLLRTHPDASEITEHPIGKTGVDQTASKSPVQMLFLGTSSMAWSDGESVWMLDGFFSRQPMEQIIFSRLKVDESRVKSVAAEVFRRLNMPEALSGVVVAHSHYDHSMDAPFLVQRYGGNLVGSESTWQIAKGQNMPATQMQIQAKQGQTRLGNFDIRLLESTHAPTGFTGGFNSKPVYLPAHALQFKEGVSYSLLLSHPVLGASPFALIQPSAGFIAGQNSAIRVNTVLLGTGGLGKLSDQYIADYWQEMVVTTQAKTVYLIHWDDFTLPLIAQGEPQALKPMPRALDDFPKALKMLKKLADRDGVALHVLDAWQIVRF